jgi:hypothetical protein
MDLISTEVPVEANPIFKVKKVGKSSQESKLVTTQSGILRDEKNDRPPNLSFKCHFQSVILILGVLVNKEIIVVEKNNLAS